MEGERVGTLHPLPQIFGGQKWNKCYIYALIEGCMRGAFPHFQIQHYTTEYVPSKVNVMKYVVDLKFPSEYETDIANRSLLLNLALSVCMAVPQSLAKPPGTFTEMNS